MWFKRPIGKVPSFPPPIPEPPKRPAIMDARVDIEWILRDIELIKRTHGYATDISGEILLILNEKLRKALEKYKAEL